MLVAVIAAVAADAAIDTAAIFAADRLAQVSVCLLTHNIVIVIAIVTQIVAAADAKLILPRMSNIVRRSWLMISNHVV